MLLIIAALVADPTIYAETYQDADRVAQAAISVKSCERFGFVTDAKGIELQAQRLIDKAVASGVPGARVESIFTSALQSEEAYQNERLKTAQAKQNFESFAEYWLERCLVLSRDSEYAPYFLLPKMK